MNHLPTTATATNQITTETPAVTTAPETTKKTRVKKLSEDKVREIVKAVEAGQTQAEVAKSFNVLQPLVSDIMSGRRWAKVTGRTYSPKVKPTEVKA